jgi:hypothetical protein
MKLITLKKLAKMISSEIGMSYSTVYIHIYNWHILGNPDAGYLRQYGVSREAINNLYAVYLEYTYRHYVIINWHSLIKSQKFNPIRITRACLAKKYRAEAEICCKKYNVDDLVSKQKRGIFSLFEKVTFSTYRVNLIGLMGGVTVRNGDYISIGMDSGFNCIFKVSDRYSKHYGSPEYHLEIIEAMTLGYLVDGRWYNDVKSIKRMAS